MAKKEILIAEAVEKAADYLRNRNIYSGFEATKVPVLLKKCLKRIKWWRSDDYYWLKRDDKIRLKYFQSSDNDYKLAEFVLRLYELWDDHFNMIKLKLDAKYYYVGNEFSEEVDLFICRTNDNIKGYAKVELGLYHLESNQLEKDIRAYKKEKGDGWAYMSTCTNCGGRVAVEDGRPRCPVCQGYGKVRNSAYPIWLDDQPAEFGKIYAYMRAGYLPGRG